MFGNERSISLLNCGRNCGVESREFVGRSVLVNKTVNIPVFRVDVRKLGNDIGKIIESFGHLFRFAHKTEYACHGSKFSYGRIFRRDCVESLIEGFEFGFDFRRVVCKPEDFVCGRVVVKDKIVKFEFAAVCNGFFFKRNYCVSCGTGFEVYFIAYSAGSGSGHFAGGELIKRIDVVAYDIDRTSLTVNVVEVYRCTDKICGSGKKFFLKSFCGIDIKFISCVNMVAVGSAVERTDTVDNFECSCGNIFSVGIFIEDFAGNGVPEDIFGIVGRICRTDCLILGINRHEIRVGGYFSRVSIFGKCTRRKNGFLVCVKKIVIFRNEFSGGRFKITRVARGQSRCRERKVRAAYDHGDKQDCRNDPFCKTAFHRVASNGKIIDKI